MHTKKTILLFLALLLPVCIFLFLKIFGKNQFDVPLLYDKGVVDKPAGCNVEYDAPYLLPDSVVGRIQGFMETPLVLLILSNNRTVAERVRDEADESEVKIISTSFSDREKKCVLLIKEPFDAVLIDRQRQIRGYYVSSNREEIDRLLIEISIILKKY